MLKTILQCLIAFIVINAISTGILMLAYWIIPAKLTLYILGSIVSVVFLITLILFGFFAVLGIKSENLKGRPASDKLTKYPENAKEIIDFLQERNFTHVGDIINDKLGSSTPVRALIFLNPSRHIVAEVTNIDHDDATDLEFYTMWENGNFVHCSSNIGFNIQKPNFTFIGLDNDLFVRYQRHVHHVKAMQSTSGKPQKITNMKQIIDFSQYEVKVAGADLNFTVITPIIKSIIQAIVPVMAFGALPLQIGAFFGLLPESQNLNPTAAYILFGVMSVLVFLSSQLTKKRVNVGWEPIDEVDKATSSIE